MGTMGHRAPPIYGSAGRDGERRPVLPGAVPDRARVPWAALPGAPEAVPRADIRWSPQEGRVPEAHVVSVSGPRPVGVLGVVDAHDHLFLDSPAMPGQAFDD